MDPFNRFGSHNPYVSPLQFKGESSHIDASAPAPSRPATPIHILKEPGTRGGTRDCGGFSSRGGSWGNF